jgi:hypothetical protein
MGSMPHISGYAVASYWFANVQMGNFSVIVVPKQTPNLTFVAKSHNFMFTRWVKRILKL